MTQPITQSQIIVHGVDFPDYFPGYGLAYTDFTEVYIGANSSAREALEECIDCAAFDGWDVTTLESELDNMSTQEIDPDVDGEDAQVYVILYLA